MNERLISLLGSLFLAVLLLGAPARAFECAALPDAPALAALDPEVRIHALAEALRAERNRVNWWSWGWGTTYAAAGVAQVAVLPIVTDPGVRIDLTIGAISAGIGAFSLYLLPLRITLPVQRAIGAIDAPDRCRVLADLEAALIGGATVQRWAKSWIGHVGNVVINLTLVLVLGVGFGRWTSAAISAGVGLLVGEANLLTQPGGMPRILERYRAGRLDELGSRAPVQSLTLAAAGPGLHLSFRF